ncbi:hypothetical protein MY1884_004529 [Beauveria asiatica]
MASSATQFDLDAELVYDYHRMHMALSPADIIFCLGSLDIRVAARAAQLFLDGLAPYLVFSGNSGKLTRAVFDRPEAEIFADVARGMGVPPERILIEPAATNTGEMCKPYMERRTWATFNKQWPDEEAAIAVTSPQLSFAEYPDEDNPRELVVNVMVGDLMRIKKYPKLGFQIEQEIPPPVVEAAQRLIAAGYNKHLP